MDSTCIHGETESGEQHDRQSRPSSDSCVKVSQLIVKRNLLVGNDSELDGFNRGAADGRSRRVFGEPQSFWRAAEFLESRRVYWRAAGFIGEPRGLLESRGVFWRAAFGRATLRSRDGTGATCAAGGRTAEKATLGNHLQRRATGISFQSPFRLLLDCSVRAVDSSFQ